MVAAAQDYMLQRRRVNLHALSNKTRMVGGRRSWQTCKFSASNVGNVQDLSKRGDAPVERRVPFWEANRRHIARRTLLPYLREGCCRDGLANVYVPQ